MTKTTHNNPPRRLIESPDLGPLIQQAKTVTFDEARLDKNRRELVKRLQDESAPYLGWFRFVLLARRRAAFAAVAVFLMISAGAAAVIYFETIPDDTDETSDAIKALAEERSKKQSKIRIQ